MTPYSTETSDRIFVRGYGFLSFAKNIGRNLSGKCSQKHFVHIKYHATDALNPLQKSNSKISRSTW